MIVPRGVYRHNPLQAQPLQQHSHQRLKKLERAQLERAP
jgi:hypothetical protein